MFIQICGRLKMLASYSNVQYLSLKVRVHKLTETAFEICFSVLNGEFRQYRGARDKEAFISFIEDKKWTAVDAVPGWKSPASFQMSIVSYFFKMSQLLRVWVLSFDFYLVL